jgi:hypothetical protein
VLLPCRARPCRQARGAHGRPAAPPQVANAELQSRVKGLLVAKVLARSL